MRRGVEVIHQAALVGDGIGGYADFLERVERPSAAGRLELRGVRRQAGADHQDLLPGAAVGLRRR